MAGGLVARGRSRTEGHREGGDKLGPPRHHRRYILTGSLAAAATFATATLVAALTSPHAAGANEYGATFTQVGATTWTALSPSGLSATVDPVDILGVAASGIGPKDLSYGTQDPEVSLGTQGLAIGITGPGGTVFSYPIEWSFDQQWHPANSVTITFDHSVVSPTIAMGTFAIGAVQSTNGSQSGAGTSSTRLRFTGASGPAGPVPLSVSAKPGFNTGLYDVSGNTITPKPVNGLIPYFSSAATSCSPAEPSKASNTAPFLTPVMPDITFISGPCGSLEVDTGGAAITQLTFVQDLTFAAGSTTAADGKWNGAAIQGPVISFSALTEVSGSATPAGLGAATHDVGTLAIGPPAESPAIRPAFEDTNLTVATAGTAEDNSDAGYTASANLGVPQLTNHTSGTFQVTVPYTGLSQDAYLAGWIDFNHDNHWDANESADSVAAIAHASGAEQSGTATLSFTLPSDPLVPTDELWLRLRIAYDRADVAQPTGMARSGEVEDHRLTVLDTTPDLDVTKTASVVGGGTAVVDSIVRYEVTVTNRSASVPADGVTISDTIPSGIAIDLSHPGTTPGLAISGETLSSQPFDLAPGASTTLTYFGTATETGTQTNAVIADTPLGCQTSDALGTPCSSSTDTDIQPAGQLQLAKTTPGLADDAVLTLGQQVTYRFTVTNDTPDPVTNIELDDPMLADAMCQLTVASLEAGESASCDATYTVTQADVDAGRIVNTATVSGEGPGGAVPGDDSAKSNDTGAEVGELAIDKTASLPGGAVSARAGDTITYRIEATNTSGYTMSGVTIDDPKVAGLACTVGGAPVSLPLASLAPDGAIVCIGTHLVTQADADAGHVANVATGTADLPPTPDDPDTPVPADVTPGHDDVPVGGLDVVKQVFLGGTEVTDQQLQLGQSVTYRITVTNTSAYPVDALAIDDPFLRDHGVAVSCDPPLPTALGHGEQVVCSGDYTVTQADIDRGHVANTATATGTWPPNPDYPGMPDGPVPTGEDSTDTPTQYPSGGGLEVAKRSVILDAPTGETKDSAARGDTVLYTVTARNTTGLTMTQVSLDDSLLPLGTGGSMCSIDAPAATGVRLPATLAPGSTLTCVASYAVTADDEAAGKVVNVVTGGGQVPGQWDPDNPGVTPPPVPLDPDPATDTQPVGGLVVTKSAAAPHSPAELGDEVRYTIKIENTSAYPMVDVVLTDSLVDAGTLTLSCEGVSGNPLTGVDLGPLASVTCTGTRTVTQDDIDAGRVLNEATATGRWGPPPADWSGPDFPSGALPPATDSVVTPTQQQAGDGLVMTKDAVVAGGRTSAREGDEITFLITAQNTSNQTMRDVRIEDELLAHAGVDLLCEPALPVDRLEPGEMIGCEATYTVTADDVARGQVANVATATGSFPPDADNPGGRPIPVVPGTSTTPAGGGASPTASPSSSQSASPSASPSSSQSASPSASPSSSATDFAHGPASAGADEGGAADGSTGTGGGMLGLTGADIAGLAGVVLALLGGGAVLLGLRGRGRHVGH